MRVMWVAAVIALAGCTTSDSGGSGGTSGPAEPPKEPRGIVGEWNLSADDSLLSCRFVVSPGGGRGEGVATDHGCIGLDGFAGFIRRWTREDGRILFFSFTRTDGPVARVRRVNANEYRGRLVPSGRKITMTRR